jgi:hypothetical protein
MASLIAKQPKDTKKQTTVSLSGTVLADLELYCRFIDSARDWVINEALKSVFRRDKAFLEWRERTGAEVSPRLVKVCRWLSPRGHQQLLAVEKQSAPVFPGLRSASRLRPRRRFQCCAPSFTIA